MVVGRWVEVHCDRCEAELVELTQATPKELRELVAEAGGVWTGKTILCADCAKTPAPPQGGA